MTKQILSNADRSAYDGKRFPNTGRFMSCEAWSGMEFEEGMAAGYVVFESRRIYWSLHKYLYISIYIYIHTQVKLLSNKRNLFLAYKQIQKTLPNHT